MMQFYLKSQFEFYLLKEDESVNICFELVRKKKNLRH